MPYAGRSAREYVGIDVHLSESQICMLTEQGGILERRIRTQPDRFAELLGERTRARFISLMRALLRREGLRVRGGMASKFLQRVAALSVPEPLSAAIAPLLAVMETLNLQIAATDAQLARHAADDPVVRRLETVPSIRQVTALSFVATLDRVERFRGPHPAAAYPGLVPGERSSGEQQQPGAITKRGNSRTRWLLVEAAWA